MWKVVLGVCAFINCGGLQEINTLKTFYNNNKQDIETIVKEAYDFIIVGAGSAGSVVANRLSENYQWRVLLLEAGKDENFITDVPLMAPFQSSTTYNWGYLSEKSNTSFLSLKNKQCKVPRGKALGGTSVINFMFYSRGNKLDYDEWSNLGNRDWNYKNLLSYFIKSENCSLNIKADEDFRGRNGNLHVQYSPYQTPLCNTFINSGLKLGYQTTDPNGKIHLGFSRVQATISNGRRWSTAKAYLKPVENRYNLKIVTNARVTKILMDSKEKQATGVTFILNGKNYAVYAKKEIIVSAGSINTPQLLMVSGIGPREDLERFNIPVIQNLKIGYNLQDHISYIQTFSINDSVNISDLEVIKPIHVFDYILRGKGPYTIPGGGEAMGFIQTNHSLKKAYDYPDIELVQGVGGINSDNLGSFRSILNLPETKFYNLYEPILFKPAYSISVVLLRPLSRGRVTLRSADSLKPPVIHLNYFQDPLDAKIMVEGLKAAKQLGESKSFQIYNSTMYHIPLKKCSHLGRDSDDYYECLIRHLATTLGHQVGTCKMGPANDPEAVVDPRLRVYGIKGLRVVDGSIMPNIIAGHTNAVIIMIGEKASDMIKSDWGYL